MNRDALTELIEKVEAGEFHVIDVADDGSDQTFPYPGLFVQAHNGSLDAAVGLLEAVLPGWRWSSAVDAHDERWFCVEDPATGEDSGEVYGDWPPARSLLIATLYALRDKE